MRGPTSVCWADLTPFSLQRLERHSPPPDDSGDDADTIDKRVTAAWDTAPVSYSALTVRTSRYRLEAEPAAPSITPPPPAQKFNYLEEFSAEMNREYAEMN
jgi:hypothetical protein